MTSSSAKEKEQTLAIGAPYPPPIPETPLLPEVLYSVYVQMEYRIPAADAPDAIGQIARDLGEGRSYKHHVEATMAINARPTT
jgi:hypothetical protein